MQTLTQLRGDIAFTTSFGRILRHYALAAVAPIKASGGSAQRTGSVASGPAIDAIALSARASPRARRPLTQVQCS